MIYGLALAFALGWGTGALDAWKKALGMFIYLILCMIVFVGLLCIGPSAQFSDWSWRAFILGMLTFEAGYLMAQWQIAQVRRWKKG